MSQLVAWHDDDLLWEMTEPAMFSPERLAAAPGEVDLVLKLSGAGPPQAVLDVGTGAGRHAIELAKRGFVVTGIDRTVRYLERAKESARQANVSLQLLNEDARKFVQKDAFDLAISLFTSFGFFDEEGNAQVLKNIATSLRPGGTLVIDVSGKETVARKFQQRSWSETSGVLVLEERKIRPDWSHVDARWIVVRDGVRKDFIVTVRLYSGLELRALLLQCGFESVELFGSLDGKPYNEDAQRLVAVAKKSA